MRSTLLDESVPRGLLEVLAAAGLAPTHAREIGLAGTKDGEMLSAVAAYGFDVFVSCDQSLAKQQNISALPFGIVIVCTNNWPTILGNKEVVVTECRRAAPGRFIEFLKGAHVTRYGRRPKRRDPDR